MYIFLCVVRKRLVISSLAWEVLFVFESDGRDLMLEDDFGFDGFVVIVPNDGLVRRKVGKHSFCYAQSFCI